MTESIGNKGVIDDLPTTLEISDTGRAASTGDCNRYFGAVTIDGDRIVFKQLASTRKACPPSNHESGGQVSSRFETSQILAH